MITGKPELSFIIGGNTNFSGCFEEILIICNKIINVITTNLIIQLLGLYAKDRQLKHLENIHWKVTIAELFYIREFKLNAQSSCWICDVRSVQQNSTQLYTKEEK